MPKTQKKKKAASPVTSYGKIEQMLVLRRKKKQYEMRYFSHLDSLSQGQKDKNYIKLLEINPSKFFLPSKQTVDNLTLLSCCKTLDP